ncbi:MAG: DUF559 domain-containing protein [Chroococcales cyanobacterium]
MSEYPIVLIPHSIARTREALPTIASFNQPAPTQPGNAPQPFKTGLLFAEGIGVFIPTAIASNFSSILAILISIFGTGLIAYQGFQQYKSFAKRLRDYENRVKSYEFRKQQYLKNKNEFEQREHQKLKSPKYITEYRLKLLEQELKRTIPHDGSNSNTRKGFLEGKFRNYLNHYFKKNIYTGLKLDIPNYEYPYTADFTYIDSQWNLYIDIEIDEPYAYQTRKPTHYDDSRRNQFFLDKGWIVIRFAEEQVCRQPESCCKVIAETISQLTNQRIDPRLLNIPKLTPIKQWTEYEARSMAEREYRQSYLDDCC